MLHTALEHRASTESSTKPGTQNMTLRAWRGANSTPHTAYMRTLCWIRPRCRDATSTFWLASRWVARRAIISTSIAPTLPSAITPHTKDRARKFVCNVEFSDMAVAGHLCTLPVFTGRQHGCLKCSRVSETLTMNMDREQGPW